MRCAKETGKSVERRRLSSLRKDSRNPWPWSNWKRNSQNLQRLWNEHCSVRSFYDKEQVEGYGAKYYEDYVELLKDSDVVSIHVPLTDQTRNMISKKELSFMKPTALIINCSRGGIINEADLVEALNNGVIAGAGTDVFCSEPPKTDDPLLNCRNLIVSPHSAAQTREAVIKMAQMCVKGCLAVAEGKKWPYVADKSVYEHEKWKGADWAEV